MTRILLVNNLSAEPFRLIKPPFGAVIEDLPPSQTWRAAVQRAADVALISVARTLDVAAVMEPIGDFGVACRGVIGSVLLLSIEALPDVASRGLPIHLTLDSETSVQLLRKLWITEFGSPPVLTPKPTEAVARLCIGNEAREQRMSGAWAHVVDLGQWWCAQTGLPFVFARWMVDASLDARRKDDVLTWLDESASYARSASGSKRMVERALAQRLFNSREAASAYFAALVSRFSPDEVHAETNFLEWMADAR